MKKVPLLFVLLILVPSAIFCQAAEYNAILLDLSDPLNPETEPADLAYVESYIVLVPDLALLEQKGMQAVTGVDPADRTTVARTFSWDDPIPEWITRGAEWQTQVIIVHRFTRAADGLYSELLWIDTANGVVSRDLLSHFDDSSLEFFFPALGLGTTFESETSTSASQKAASASAATSRPSNAAGDAASDHPVDEATAVRPLLKGDDDTSFNAISLDFTDPQVVDDETERLVDELKNEITAAGEIILASGGDVQAILDVAGHAQKGPAVDLGAFGFNEPVDQWYRRADEWGLRYILLYRLTTVFDRQFAEWLLVDAEAREAASERIGLSGGFSFGSILTILASRQQQMDADRLGRVRTSVGAGRSSAGDSDGDGDGEKEAAVSQEAEEGGVSTLSDGGKALPDNEDAVDLSLSLFGEGGYGLLDLAKINSLTVGGGASIALENLPFRDFGIAVSGSFMLGIAPIDAVVSLQFITAKAYVSYRIRLGNILSITPMLGGGGAYITGAFAGNLASSGPIEGLIGTVDAGLMVRVGGSSFGVFLMPTVTYYIDPATSLDVGAIVGFHLF